MSYFYEPEIEKDKVKEVIAWLQHCFEMLESGQEDQISYDIFYRSPKFANGIIPDDYTNRIIKTIEAEFVYELARYPGYHFQHADGATHPPEFTRLSMQGRRSLVQGLDKILAKYSTVNTA